jgi:hypothetical protein
MSVTPYIRHFEGRAAYETAIDELLAGAQARICVFEPALSPQYNSSRRQEVLRAFLRADRTRQIRIVVHDAASIPGQCPRLMQLLRQFSHALHIHETPEEGKRIYDPFCLIDSLGYVRKFHFEDARGVTSKEDEPTASELMRRFDELWELSTPAVTATILGL